MIKGAFTLIQCVQVNNTKVLYIYGSVKCDKWWQVAIEIFSFSNIIPALFVLSSTPYYVRDRKISLITFHLACLFPIPVLIFHIFNTLMQLFMQRRAVSLEIISMREHLNSGMGKNIDLDLHSDTTDHSNASVDTLGLKYSISSSDTDLGSEYSHDSIVDNNISNNNESDSETNELQTSRQQVIHTF